MNRFGHLCLLLFFLIQLACGQDFTTSFQAGQPYSAEFAEEVFSLLRSFERAKEPELAPDTANLWLKWNTVDNFRFGKNRGSIPMIADVNSLHPYFRDKVLALISACHSKGIELAIVETFRTKAKQNEYKSMGKKYTRSGGGHSKHQYGLAVDLVPMINDSAVWHNDLLWRKIGLAGERLGLRWGGRWRHPYDPGHFEWTGGLSSPHLARGTYPRLPIPLNYPCINEDLQRLKEYWSEWETEQASLARQSGPLKRAAK